MARLYCARFASVVEASLVAAVEGATLAVSVLGAVVVEALGEGVDGADATVGSGVVLGAGKLELAVDGVFDGVGAGAGVEP